MVVVRTLAVGLACVLSSLGFGQLSPNFLYNPVDQPFEITVTKPQGARELTIQLLAAGSAEMLSEKVARPGKMDLARLFPTLWKDKIRTVHYVQLFADEKPFGAPLVLVPMTNPAISRLNAEKKVEFVADEDDAFAGIRCWVDQVVNFETSLGDMSFRLRPDCAPNTCYNLIQLIEGGFYRNIPVHRIVNKDRNGKPFVVQAGDPTGTGMGSPGYAIALEKSPLGHDFGVISMARSSDPNTIGSQFFVALSREATARLDGLYPAFGQIISGAETLNRLAAVEVGEGDRPKQLPIIKRIWLSDALPYRRIIEKPAG